MMILSICSEAAYTEAWYAGPLLSEPAIITPIGHGYIQTVLFKVMNYGAYDSTFAFESLPLASTGEVDTTFNYGITKDTEAQVIMTFLDNKTQGRQAQNLGDTTVSFSHQLTLQNGRKWPPSIKVMFHETFPTGHYDALRESLFGTNATGQGSYLSMLAANMEHVIWLGGTNYLVSFATITFTYPSLIKLQGYSIYGGGPATDGKMWPGKSLAFNLAVEYTPNNHYGLILETFILTQEPSHFKGNIGPTTSRFVRTGGTGTVPDGRHPLARRVILNRLRQSVLNLGGFQRDIGHGNLAEFTFAPAVAYNFSQETSITAGAWFTSDGKNIPAFYSPMVKLTAGW